MPRINERNWDRHPNEQHTAAYWGRRLEKAYPPDRNLPPPNNHPGHRSMHTPDRLIYAVTVENMTDFTEDPLGFLKGRIQYGGIVMTRPPITDEGETDVLFNVYFNGYEPDDTDADSYKAFEDDIVVEAVTQAAFDADASLRMSPRTLATGAFRTFGVNDSFTVVCVDDGNAAAVGPGTVVLGGHFE